LGSYTRALLVSQYMLTTSLRDPLVQVVGGKHMEADLIF
jgi:hypothetical protein